MLINERCLCCGLGLNDDSPRADMGKYEIGICNYCFEDSLYEAFLNALEKLPKFTGWLN